MVVVTALFFVAVLFGGLGVLNDVLPARYQFDNGLALLAAVGASGFAACMGWLG